MAFRCIVALATLALLAAWFFVPLPAPEPLLSVEVQRGPEASSLDRSYPFQFAMDSPQPTLRVHTDLGQGDVLVELLDAAGVAPVLRLPCWEWRETAKPRHPGWTQGARRLAWANMAGWSSRASGAPWCAAPAASGRVPPSCGSMNGDRPRPPAI